MGRRLGGSYSGAAYLVLGASLDGTRELDLSLADTKFIGEATGDQAGVSVAGAGDVDGDGLDDLLIGAYQEGSGGSGAGATYLVLGASLGSTSFDLSSADYKFVGESSDDRSGQDVAGAGDVDGDGLDDLLIGAYYEDSGGSGAGAAYLVLASSLGSSGSMNLSAADYKFIGEESGDAAGRSVSTAGDVDGDGLDDLLISAYLEDDGSDSRGATYIILASSLGRLQPPISISCNADYKLVGEGP